MPDPVPPSASPSASRSADVPDAPETPGAARVVLRGEAAAPGVVIAPAHRKEYELDRARAVRIPRDAVERELNRFRAALDASQRQLAELRVKLRGQVSEADARILDTHVTLLKDSVFIADVERLVLEDCYALDAAIARVVADFDRIFQLVADERLRQGAVDLRDVGLRVLRNLDGDGVVGEPPAPERYVLVARELSIVDMFNLEGEHVAGIAIERGSLTGHAAVFARSMGIPTLVGVDGLLEAVGEGETVLLDADEGLLRVAPEESLRAALGETERGGPAGELLPRADGVETQDGEAVELLATCGNLAEARQAADAGFGAIGLYRTELLFVVDGRAPRREALVARYRDVCEAIGGPVTFRQLSVRSDLGVPYLFGEREPNPLLGRRGVRFLLDREELLRLQLQALLLAGAEREVSLAIPFCTDLGEFHRVRDALVEERHELGKQRHPVAQDVPIGVVVETPAALAGIEAIAAEADSIALHLDSLSELMLAADRALPAHAAEDQELHPFVLRALEPALAVRDRQGRAPLLLGGALARVADLERLVGLGARRLCVAPVELETVVPVLGAVDTGGAIEAARTALRAGHRGELRSPVGEYHHGFAPR